MLWRVGSSGGHGTVVYTLPAYFLNYKYGTTIRHGTRSAVSSGVASITDRLFGRSRQRAFTLTECQVIGRTPSQFGCMRCPRHASAVLMYI